MTLLNIVKAPDIVLKTRASNVEAVTPDIVKLTDDMLETMYRSRGIGLAANQVGVLQRVLVLDVDYHEDGGDENPLRIINPEIIHSSDRQSTYNEGCLSFPGQYSEVERPAEIKIRYLDHTGKELELEASGLLATCLQHEIDHINGIVFVDHISRLKRDMILRKMQKIKKNEHDECGHGCDHDH